MPRSTSASGIAHRTDGAYRPVERKRTPRPAIPPIPPSVRPHLRDESAVVPPENVLHFGEPSAYDDLPFFLQEKLAESGREKDLRNRVWRRITIDYLPANTYCAEFRTRVRSMTYPPGSPALPAERTEGGLRYTRIESLTLTRVRDDGYPTRFFIAVSPETGIAYWAEY
ncbi:MAG: hypothetical protein SFU56_22130 [Capsulimonadales bacterium]|nr:hypothetical protein [Capsulimonadales bacterium]